MTLFVFKNLIYFVFVFFLNINFIVYYYYCCIYCICLPLKYLEFEKPLALNSMRILQLWVCLCVWMVCECGGVGPFPTSEVLAHDVGMHTLLRHDIPEVRVYSGLFVYLTIIVVLSTHNSTWSLSVARVPSMLINFIFV